MVEGTVEVRSKPEMLRVVIALTSEGASAEECQRQIKEQTAAIRQDWLSMQIPEENIVEDFISVLPRYEWESGKWEEENIRIQKHNGYRMQSNLHLVVENETDAMQAIDKAFRHGVAEVVTFDYWSSNLTEEKQKAMSAAVEAAKAKAKILLAVFDAPPKVINVQESTKVYFPHELYRTYENVLEEDYLGRYWKERAQIKAYRPKMTFYQGMTQQSDIIPKPIALHPEISIVSTVRIYYQSPADKEVEDAE
ncbi:MAG: SIMPL domain-containing protein [Planctomicrobium sp.]|nr:SIMPL domain-containing protein [Planctomicrobium sp.]